MIIKLSKKMLFVFFLILKVYFFICSLNVNVWQALAEFLTKLECVEKFPVCFDQNDDAKLSFKNISSHFESNLLKQYELVQLPEDWFLDGFVFLQHSPKTSKYVQTPFVLVCDFCVLFM